MSKKHIFIIFLFITTSGLMFFFIFNKNECIPPERKINKKELKNSACNVIKPVEEVSVNDKSKKKTEQKEEQEENNRNIYTWVDLNIEPTATIEGSFYTFSAFEVIDSNLVIAGNYNGRNLIKFISCDSLTNLEIDDLPLDLICFNKTLYVLCFQSIYQIKNKTVQQRILFSIPQITLYDKLLFFDENLNILMSDGSSYYLNKDEFIKTSALRTEGNSLIWVKKRSPKSFEIKSKPNNITLNKEVFFEKEIGSVTIIGNSSQNYFCIVDIIENLGSRTIKREIFSSKDNFKKAKFILPEQNFSYIKNDVKIHNNILHTVKLDKKGITLEKFDLRRIK